MEWDWVLGRLAIGFGDLSALTRLDTPLDCYLVQGAQEIDLLPTAFVKDVPEELAQRLRRETRLVNASGPQADRHRTAPWLYPVAGKGEAPRVFEEDGRRYYPIWGTWTIHNSGGAARCDENRRPLVGALLNNHTHTTVDYFVVEIASVPPTSRSPPTSKE
jgi:hypothetical protein